jgi:hypothetical protein
VGFARFHAPDLRFVLTRLSGAIDDQALCDHVLALNEEAAATEGLRELAVVDPDADASGITVQGTYEAARLEAGRPRTVGGRLAICVSNELHFGLARVYATGSDDTREDRLVGYSVPEALDWLAGSDADRRALEAFIRAQWPDAPLAD